MIRTGLRWLLGLFYAYAGYKHLADPAPFLTIVPEWVPAAPTVVKWTGIAEIAGALALLQPLSHRLMRAGGIGLALYALCVWPANVNHMLLDMAKEDGGWGLGYHVPRLLAQPIIIWLSLWTARVTDWPFHQRG